MKKRFFKPTLYTGVCFAFHRSHTMFCGYR